jgi:hypothetical protein
MAKNSSNEAMKRLTLAKNLSDEAFNASSHRFIASVAQLWILGITTYTVDAIIRFTSPNIFSKFHTTLPNYLVFLKAQSSTLGRG